MITTLALLEFDCVVENLGPDFLVGALPCPVRVSFAWRNKVTGEESIRSGSIRTLLPRTIPPEGSLTVTCHITTPDEPGNYVLVLTVVEEHVAWFDHLDESNALYRDVTVLEKAQPNSGRRQDHEHRVRLAPARQVAPYARGRPWQQDQLADGR